MVPSGWMASSLSRLVCTQSRLRWPRSNMPLLPASSWIFLEPPVPSRISGFATPSRASFQSSFSLATAVLLHLSSISFKRTRIPSSATRKAWVTPKAIGSTALPRSWFTWLWLGSWVDFRERSGDNSGSSCQSRKFFLNLHCQANC